MMSAAVPLRTPSPSPFKTKAALIDSPFSDYYTDTSPAFSPATKFTSPFQQKLLTRLNSIGTQVLRRSLSDDASKDIEVGLDALENRIQAPEVKSREPADVADSGLFVDDDDDDDDIDVYDSQDDSSDGADEMAKSRDGLGMRMSSSPEEEFLDSPLGSVKGYLADKVVMDEREAEALVMRVTKVANELRQRYEEVKHLNDQTVSRLETASDELLHLRSENEALRADLSFDHSELLFLKLQLKAVQLSIEPQLPADGQYTSSVSKSLSEGLERWKKDWKDVDLKFQARRAKYGMAEPTASAIIDQTTATSATESSESAQKPGPAETRLPTKIVSIRRPTAPRSFPSPPVKNASPLPAEPLTPSLTSESESGDGDDDDAEDHDEVPSQKLAADGSAGAASADESADDDEGGEDDADSSEGEDVEEGEEESVGGSELGDTAAPSPKSTKTPWQELWDGLADFAGMRPDDD